MAEAPSEKLLDRLPRYKLERDEIEQLWLSVRDLMRENQPRTARELVFAFLGAITLRLDADLQAFRGHFLQVLRNHDVPEDAGMIVRVLTIMTRGLVRHHFNILHHATARELLSNMCTTCQESAVHAYGAEAAMVRAQSLRGTVNILSRLAWRDLEVQNISIAPQLVLPSFLPLVRAELSGVVFEIVLSVRHLMERRKRLSGTAWSAVFKICLHASKCLPSVQDANLQFQLTINHVVQWARQLLEQDRFLGDVEDIYRMLELSNIKHDVAEAMEFYVLRLSPLHADWLYRAELFINSFIVREKRRAIRLKAIDHMSRVVQTNAFVYDQQLLHGPIRKHLSHLYQEPDVAIQKRLIEFFTEIARAAEECFPTCMEILEQGFDLILDSSRRPPAAGGGDGIVSTDLTTSETSNSTRGREDVTNNDVLTTFVQCLVSLATYKFARGPIHEWVRPAQLLVQYTRFVLSQRQLRSPEFAIGALGDTSDTNLEVHAAYDDMDCPPALLAAFDFLSNLRWDPGLRVYLTPEIPANLSSIFMVPTQEALRQTAVESDIVPMMRAVFDILSNCIMKIVPFELTRRAAAALCDMLTLTQVFHLHLIDADRLGHAVSKAVLHFKDPVSAGYLALHSRERDQVFSILLECLRRHLPVPTPMSETTRSRSSTQTTPSKGHEQKGGGRLSGADRDPRMSAGDVRASSGTSGAPVDVPQGENGTNSNASGSASSDTTAHMPAYMRMLTLHVLSLWYVRSPLNDRATYAKAISDALIDIEHGKTVALRMSNEGQVLLQLLGRYMYSDHIDAYSQALPPDVESLFRMKNASTLSYLPSDTHVTYWRHGNVLVTARCSPSGWMEMRLRSSVGTVAWITRIMSNVEPVLQGSSALDVWLKSLGPDLVSHLESLQEESGDVFEEGARRGAPGPASGANSGSGVSPIVNSLNVLDLNPSILSASPSRVEQRPALKVAAQTQTPAVFPGDVLKTLDEPLPAVVEHNKLRRVHSALPAADPVFTFGAGLSSEAETTGGPLMRRPLLRSGTLQPYQGLSAPNSPISRRRVLSNSAISEFMGTDDNEDADSANGDDDVTTIADLNEHEGSSDANEHAEADELEEHAVGETLASARRRRLSLSRMDRSSAAPSSNNLVHRRQVSITPLNLSMVPSRGLLPPRSRSVSQRSALQTDHSNMASPASEHYPENTDALDVIPLGEADFEEQSRIVREAAMQREDTNEPVASSLPGSLPMASALDMTRLQRAQLARNLEENLSEDPSVPGSPTPSRGLRASSLEGPASAPAVPEATHPAFDPIVMRRAGDELKDHSPGAVSPAPSTEADTVEPSDTSGSMAPTRTSSTRIDGYGGVTSASTTAPPTTKPSVSSSEQDADDKALSNDNKDTDASARGDANKSAPLRSDPHNTADKAPLLSDLPLPNDRPLPLAKNTDRARGGTEPREELETSPREAVVTSIISKGSTRFDAPQVRQQAKAASEEEKESAPTKELRKAPSKLSAIRTAAAVPTRDSISNSPSPVSPSDDRRKQKTASQELDDVAEESTSGVARASSTAATRAVESTDSGNNVDETSSNALAGEAELGSKTLALLQDPVVNDVTGLARLNDQGAAAPPRHSSLDSSLLEATRRKVREQQMASKRYSEGKIQSGHARETGDIPESNEKKTTGRGQRGRRRSSTIAAHPQLAIAQELLDKFDLQAEDARKESDIVLSSSLIRFAFSNTRMPPYLLESDSLLALQRAAPPNSGDGHAEPARRTRPKDSFTPAPTNTAFTEKLFDHNQITISQNAFENSELYGALQLLDRTPALETHKIGVVYVAPGQASAPEILRNPCGSLRYTQFLEGLGNLIRLRNASEYCGGLDTKEDRDGLFAYVWKDALTSVVFHVATLMPNLERDEKCMNKTRFISNDHVTLVFNDSHQEFDRDWLPGAVNFVFIVIEPLDSLNYRVSVHIRKGMEKFVAVSSHRIVSTEYAAIYVRQVAMHANLAVLAHRKQPTTFLDRFKQIERILERFGVPFPDNCNPAHVAWTLLP
ncbi:uncharacterized protein MONBRDRAFT_39243 [Monosiga brevicollis MX1]|uniref:Rap-GAP domain-containing protein n=1 Tax=Monosiga brevicollis TaxID=81824 RepID=A9VD67_MONBE|nr:uncharacterized protein MONBRDRAFT_39243 [Monosiga brevicollis MX1]EDQ84502.1 predicted protein [Monosiga brevicollis MX1]|eukprot:XP_001750689.1 hypothetical protein [Monosiga brevicollis MX1]